MKEFRKILAMILCAVLCLSLLPMSAFAEERQEQDESVIAEEIVEEESVSDEVRAAGTAYSGTWGNLKWTISAGSGLLTISGNGKMEDFDDGYSSQAWLEYREYINAVEIGSGVTSIGKWAFKECNGLMSVAISESVGSIGDEAFANCRSLMTILFLGSPPHTIVEDVFENITAKAYYPTNKGWTESKMLDYGGELTWVPYDADNIKGKWGNLTWSLDIKTGVLTISGNGEMEDLYYTRDAWLEYREYIKSVEIESGVTSIGEDAFIYCYYITSVTIPESVTSIGYEAFYNCRGLTNLTIPEGVLDFERYAFCGCSSLTSVTIPNGVSTITDYMFLGCKSLTSVSIPGSVKRLGRGAFKGCSGLTSVAIPESVSFIWDEAFYNCSSLTSVTIPESVTDICWKTFAECSSLKEIHFLGAPPTKIDEDVFENVTATVFYPANKGWTASNMLDYHGNLTWFQLDADSVGGIWGNLLWALNTKTGLLTISGDGEMDDFASNPTEAWHAYKDKIKSVQIESGIKSIGAFAFFSCANLTSVTIPEGVSRLGNGAFALCGVTSVSVPEGVTSIEGSTFWGCTSLTSVTIPKGVLSIEDYAFALCSSLTSVTIPEGVTRIGSNAFINCSSLTSLAIPGSVTSIGLGAVAYCPSLKEIRFRGAPPTIDNTAFTSVTTTAYYPANRGWTASNMLDYGGSLTWISFDPIDFVLPAALTALEAEAFAGIAARSVLIPETVTIIEGNPFAGSQVTTIYGYADSPAQTLANAYGYTFVPVT